MDKLAWHNDVHNFPPFHNVDLRRASVPPPIFLLSAKFGTPDSNPFPGGVVLPLPEERGSGRFAASSTVHTQGQRKLNVYVVLCRHEVHDGPNTTVLS